jgi:hypothetical protein
MSPEEKERASGSDSVEGMPGERPFDVSATAWLVGEGVRYLNTPSKEGELAYERVAELLRESKDAGETVINLLQQQGSGDAPLRWSLLYLLGEVADATAADSLVRFALEPLPEEGREEGCEGSRDMELLVRTRAVGALRSVAERHPDSREHLLKIVSEKPDRAILIEAVKAGADVGLKDKMRELLPEEDQWILDIRQARAEELFAEPERDDGQEVGFTPPKIRRDYDAPRVARRVRKEP